MKKAHRIAKFEKLTEICIQWNLRKLPSKEAMNQVWNLFKKENMVAWCRYLKETKTDGRKRVEMKNVVTTKN